MATLLTQSDFAKAKGVNRATITKWKTRGHIVMSGEMVDLDATEKKLISGSRRRSKKSVPAVADRVADGVASRETVAERSSGNTEGNTKGNRIGNTVPAANAWPASVLINGGSGLPAEADLHGLMIDSGAEDMAILLIRHGLSRAEAEPLVAAWVAKQRRGSAEMLDDALEPPPGCKTWAEAAPFTRSWLVGAGAEWAEIEQEAAATS